MPQIGRHARLLFVFLCLAVSGCIDDQEPIIGYSVKKHASIQIPIETEATEELENATHRLLAAIVLDDGLAWFFKSVSPLDDVTQETLDQFRQMLQDLRLENTEKPTWQLSEEWDEQPASGMRIANLRLGKIEFAVSKLPMRSDEVPRQYLLNNINRWRRQVRRLPISAGQLEVAVTKLKTADDHAITLVDVEGIYEGNTMPGMGAGRPPADTGRSRPEPLSYTPPKHWNKQPAGSMQVAKFTTGEGDAKAEISISQLGGAAGGVLPNVNRWRGQVGLEPLTDQNDVEAEVMKVSGNDAALLEFRGTKGKSILVAMVNHDESVWFFKMMGDTTVVDQETTHFREFLATVGLD